MPRIMSGYDAPAHIYWERATGSRPRGEHRLESDTRIRELSVGRLGLALLRQQYASAVVPRTVMPGAEREKSITPIQPSG